MGFDMGLMAESKPKLLAPPRASLSDVMGHTQGPQGRRMPFGPAHAMGTPPVKRLASINATVSPFSNPNDTVWLYGSPYRRNRQDSDPAAP